MRRVVASFITLVALQATVVVWRRTHPRVLTAWVNSVVDPWLVREGIVDRSEGELGLIEHVGRTSGIVRLTPIHPVATEDGFRIVVPLGAASQWATNVVAAGRCRLQIDGVIHALDRPTLVPPAAVAGLPPFASRMMDGLGFRYLVLHEVSAAPGMLQPDQLVAA